MGKLLILILPICISCATTSDSTRLASEIKQYNLTNVDTLLDIGCGDAYFDKMIYKTYPSIFFILEDLPFQIRYSKKPTTDKNKKYPTEERIKQNFRNSPAFPQIDKHFEIVIGSHDSIPLPTESFKRILCRKTFHEFKYRERMASELTRILSIGGILTIAEASPKFAGERDPYCKSVLLTKEEINRLFPTLHLISEDSVDYKKTQKLFILNFMK